MRRRVHGDLKRVALLTAAALSLAACGGGGRLPIGPKHAADTDWRRAAMPADRARIRDWRETWLKGLAAAKGADGGMIAREGVLFQVDRALSGAMPSPGAYRCRTFKLGAQGTGMQKFVAYPAFDCRVDDEGEVRSFYKSSGSQRPVGLIFPDAASRGVFLGTLVLGDERHALQYGRDANRDMAGIVERIAPQRWRIVLPEPRFESKLDVIELVPAR